ncbi:MAG: hypothetical protein CMO55_27525 [Verrucomicrobiales bacterium]|nr:hypothetical protein [Verrucomicrobiales bacterium]
MNADILLRYLHFISIFLVIAVVFTQHMLLKKSMLRSELLKVHRLDMVYGIAAVVVFATGLIQWLGADFGKPADFYSKNPILHTKVTLFLIVGILSIFPTLFYFKNKKGNPGDEIGVSKGVIMIVRMELLLLFIIPLLAVLMARGVGNPIVE